MPVSGLLFQNGVFSILIKRSKSLAYTKIPQKTENLSKWFGVHSFELFAANTRSFQVKKLSSKTLVTLSEEAQFI